MGKPNNVLHKCPARKPTYVMLRSILELASSLHLLIALGILFKHGEESLGSRWHTLSPFGGWALALNMALKMSRVKFSDIFLHTS